MGYRIAAINDDADHCSRCGKTGLKRVAWVYREEDGPTIQDPVGLDCLAILLGYGKRTAGKVPQKAVRRALLDHYINLWRSFLATPVIAKIHLAPGKFLRAGEMDYQVTIGEIVQRSPAEHGVDAAVRFALWAFVRHHMNALGQTWREDTGLASNPSAHEAWPQELRKILPPIEKTILT